METYVKGLVDEAKVMQIGCPCCEREMKEESFKELLKDGYWEKYQKFYNREILRNNPYVRFCPQADCEGYALGSVKKPKVVCGTCKFEFCYLCRSLWHEEECEKKDEADFEYWAIVNNVKFCPRCKRRVEKNGGCMNMTCLCMYNWCWKCGQIPSAPLHGITCLVGNNIWNLKKSAICLMVFAPISVFFIPLIIFFYVAEVFPEVNAAVYRNRHIIFVLLLLFSPVIEVGCLIGFSIYFALECRWRVQNYFIGVQIVIFIVALVSGLLLAVLGAATIFFLSFPCTVFGLVFLSLRGLRDYCGKRDFHEDFYPQSNF